MGRRHWLQPLLTWFPEALKGHEDNVDAASEPCEKPGKEQDENP